MDDTTLHRRRVLAVAGSAAVAGLAGCIGGGTTEAVSSPTDASDDHEGTGSHQEEAETHQEEAESSHEETDGHHEETEDGHGEPGHDDGGETSDDGHHHDGPVGEPADHAEVAMQTLDDGHHFAPHVVRVTTGGEVTWTNESGVHTATAYAAENDRPQLVPDEATSWDSGLLEAEGATFEHTFETEGVYHYYCTPHETVGMLGSVIVGDPDPHDQPALGEPPADMPDPVREKIQSLNATCSEALEGGH